jgi:hypothetical protein
MTPQDTEALRTENADLRRLLAKHQWSGLTPIRSRGVCPECCASSRSPEGHRPGCAIAAALDSREGAGAVLSS